MDTTMIVTYWLTVATCAATTVIGLWGRDMWRSLDARVRTWDEVRVMTTLLPALWFAATVVSVLLGWHEAN